MGAAGSFNIFLVIFLLIIFGSEVASTIAEAVGGTDDDSTVEERGAAVEVRMIDMVDNIDNNQDCGSEIRLL